MGIFQELFESLDKGLKGSEVAPPRLYPVKNRISMIGTVGSGKSTVVGGIVMTAETLVQDQEHFFCRVLEGTSEIHQDVSNLRDGHFPEKTVAFGEFASESGLLMEWERKIAGFKFKTKRLQVPICDLAGEDLQQTIRQYRTKVGPLGNVIRNAVRNLVAYVRESDGFIITIKATRAKGLFQNGKQLEEEADARLSRDPDVNLVRLLEDLITYKETHRSRPIKGIAVVITAWDALKSKADEIGFDILSPTLGQNDLLNFVKGYFPAVYAAIKSYRIPNVQYFPSFFEVEQDEFGNARMWDKASNSPKIKLRQMTGDEDWWRNARKPSYYEVGYVNLIEWLHAFAM